VENDVSTKSDRWNEDYTTPSSTFNFLPQDLPIDFVAMVPYQVYEIVRSSTASRFDEVKKVIIAELRWTRIPKQNCEYQLIL
jgi:hypothetical protein